MALLPFPQSDVRPHFRNPNPNPSSSFILSRKSLSPKILYRNDRRNFRVYAIASRISNPSGASPTRTETLRPYPALLQLAASAIFFVSLGARACTSGPAPIPSVQVATCQLVQESVRESADCGVRSTEPESGNQVVENSDVAETVEDKELKAAFERWKSKTYALTVPLRIVALRGSIPPSWIKEFVQVQGKRLKLQSELRGSLEHIFSDLALAFKKGRVEPKSTMAADIVTIGDSWLHLAISKGIIEPIHDVEGQNWFKSLDDKWKAYLRRNSKGELDSDGKIWGAPYRWGSMVIAYKKNKFRKHNLAPIEDWRDLWRPELAGRISMVDAPREVVGAVLKYMGASYNTKDIESQVGGGRNATMQNLAMLQRQVRLFDSVHYLKAFGVGDVWVAVGWSSDVLPAAKRISNVAVIVPKSGTSLWADLWAIPAATKFTTNQIGGRVRSPSPLIHQWIEFCLQAARALPFRQEVIPGASPLSLEDIPVKEGSLEFSKVRPKLDTNLVAGVPPPEILAKCEFLEPLSEATLMDYQWLIAGMQKQGRGWIESMLHGISSKTFQFKLGTQKP
ncbi:uncharacterized protein LOC131233206 isoform X1 [Magnolia sinica]|uniref:uncharacterized protein LOC131233206 isoform X1 n=1 Tax=Magnolia sinica TaxID=86752 RepID=UPI00265ADFB4|nr:uncharacterized protein LOC131233206 isoform X1 [Magnolia sinica]